MTGSHSVEVVRATLDHLDPLTRLFDGYRQFYEQPSNLEGARLFLQARLERDESVIFMARLNGTSVGFVQLYPAFSSVSLKRLWILNDLFVAQVARRHGVATTLILRATAFARDSGAKGLVLETAHNNLTAQRLYERLGWRRDEEFYRYGLYFQG